MKTGVTTLHSCLHYSLWQAGQQGSGQSLLIKSNKGTLEEPRAIVNAFFMKRFLSLSVAELYGGVQSSIQHTWMVNALENGWRQLNEALSLRAHCMFTWMAKKKSDSADLIKYVFVVHFTANLLMEPIYPLKND